MATTERPPSGEKAANAPQLTLEQDRGELTLTALTAALRHPRWRTQRTRELLRLASEADMFVWEKVRLRDLRYDLDAATRRRDAREPLGPGDARDGMEGGLELVDFERDSWPN